MRENTFWSEVLDQIKFPNADKEIKDRLTKPCENGISIELPMIEALKNKKSFGTGEVQTDITKYQRSTQALRELKNKYRTLVEKSLDAIAIVKGDKFVFVNKAFLEMFGYESDKEVIGSKIADYLAPQSRELVISRGLARERGEEVPAHYEAKVQKKDGTIFDVELSVGLITFQGEIARQGIIRDITQRKKMEQALRESEEKFRLFQSSVFDVIYRYDPQNNRYDFISPSVEQQTGYTVEEFSSCPKEITQRITHPEDWVRVQDEVKRQIAKGPLGGPFRIEYRVIRKDGKEIWVSDQKTLEFSPEGKLCRINGVVRNITERKRAEEALKETNTRHQTLIQAIPDIVYFKDNQGRNLITNRAFEELVGLKEAEIVGKRDEELLPPDLAEHCRRSDEKVLRRGKPLRFEEESTTKDGKKIFFETIKAPIYDDLGSAVGLVGVSRDITERKRTERALQQSEKKYRQLIENMREGIWCIDKDAYTTFANPRMAELLGYSVEEMQGRHLFSFMDDHGVELCNRYLERRKQGIKERHDFEFLRKDGTRVYTSMETSPIVDGDGNYLGAVACVADITERKRAEEALRESEEKFRSLAEESPNMIFINKKGRVVYANERCEEIMGYKREEFYSPDFDFFALIAPEFRELVKGNFSTHLKGKEVNPLDYALVTKEGKRIEAILNTKLITFGGESAILGIVTDITERRRAMEKLKEYTRQIEEKNRELKAKNQELTATRAQLVQEEKLRALGQMASGLAHNFNNLLAVVLGRAQLLQLKAKKLDIEKGLRSIEKAALDASSTIKRIQDFARVRKDQEFKRVNIDKVIEEVIALTKAQWKDQAEANGINIRVEVQKDLHKLPPVAADESGLREVFTNIIFNAVEAMPKGGKITIRSRTDGKSIFVSVADSGVGIPKRIKPKIFDPFFTTKGVTKAGLGLSAAYGIIQRHRGDIQIESKPGEGTTVVVKFPVSKILGREKPKEKESERPMIQRESTRILIIEDQKDVRELLFDILSSANYTVKLASGGVEGLDICKRERFDIVFTDLGMPKMSGWEVAKAIKEIDWNTTVFLITGWGVDMDGEKLKESGIDRVVTKPIRVETLLALVSETIESKKKTKEPMEGSLVHPVEGKKD